MKCGTEFLKNSIVPWMAICLAIFKEKTRSSRKGKCYKKTKEYKAGRSKNRYVKYAEAHVSQLEEMKTGVMYQTGVAVKAAKKSVKNSFTKKSRRYITQGLEVSLLSQRFLFYYWA